MLVEGTYKTTRIIITDSFGIPKSFQKGVGIQYNIFDMLYFWWSTRNACNVAHNVASCHSFSCTWFSTVTNKKKFNVQSETMMIF